MSAALNWDEFKRMLVEGVSAVGTLFTGAITTTGDIDAGGGFRTLVGPFVQTDLAASQTDARLALGDEAAPNLDVIMPRAGSLVGICAGFTVAPAGSTMTVSVFKNGALMHATAVLSVTAGATLGRVALFSKDTANLSFAAADRIGVAITTDGSWTAITSDITVFLWVEC